MQCIPISPRHMSSHVWFYFAIRMLLAALRTDTFMQAGCFVVLVLTYAGEFVLLPGRVHL